MTVEKIFEFIQKQRTAFLSTVDADGFPNIKAMNAPRKIDGTCFYFSTNTSSQHTRRYRENPKACIYFYNKGRFRYEGVMLTGTMEVLEEPEYKESIWQTGDTMYYPGGVTDPDYCVLRFTSVQGRHYCNFKSESFDL